VAACGASFTDADFSQGQVQVVMDYYQVVQTDLELLHKEDDCLAAGIHVSLWFGQQDLFSGYRTGAGTGLALLFIQCDMMLPGDMVDA
jgi:hypothetical protein